MRCFWITLLQTPMSWAFIVPFAGIGIVGFSEYVPPTWHNQALVVVAATGISVALREPSTPEAVQRLLQSPNSMSVACRPVGCTSRATRPSELTNTPSRMGGTDGSGAPYSLL
jgi:hypothetical protein